MGNGLSEILIVLIILIIVIYVFIRISIRMRKHGGSISTTLFASTYEFYNKDKRKAIEQIVEVKANKKMEEEASDKPKEDD